MKKVLAIIPALVISVQAFAEDFNNVYGSSNAETPILFSTSTWGNGSTLRFLYKGILDVNPGASWLNAYVAVDGNYIISEIMLSGTYGYHNNLYMTFQDTTLSFASALGINYNGAYYSTDIYYEAADGMTGTINATNATGITFDLATTDSSYNFATNYGLKGRIVSIGENITYNVTKDLTVKGRLTTAQTTYTDSEFIVAGTLNTGGTSYFQGAKATISGMFTATGGIQITPYTTTINSVSVTFATDFLVGSTGTVKTDTFGLRGGAAVINGTLIGLDGSSAVALKFGFVGTSASYTSNLTIGDSASVSIGAITADNGTLNLHSNLSATSLTSTASYTSAINVASGKTLSLASATINGNTTFGGAGATSISGILQNTGTTTINSGTVVNVGSASLNDTVLNNNGSLVVKGTLNVNSARTGWYNVSSIAGNLTIDGGLVEDKTVGTYAASMQLLSGKTLSIQNGGTLRLGSNLYLYFASANSSPATLSVDSSSYLEVKNLQFANGGTGRVVLSSSTNLVFRTDLFVSGANTMATSKAIVELAKDQTFYFGKMIFVRNCIIDIHFKEASEIVFEDAILNSSSTATAATLNLYDFTNGTFKIESVYDSSQIYEGNKIIIGTVSGAAQYMSLFAYDKNGNLYNGIWTVDVAGYLNNSAVPEPATWAAIFGAIALFFAVRRRRK